MHSIDRVRIENIENIENYYQILEFAKGKASAPKAISLCLLVTLQGDKT